MAQKGREFVGLEKNDTYQDIEIARAGDEQFDNELCENVRRVEENDLVDADLKEYLSFITTKEDRFEPDENRKENDNDVNESESEREDEIDPDYDLVLKCMKEHGKSYSLTGERDGVPLVAIYEEDISSDSEGDSEPKRKTRSASRDEHRVSDQMSDVEIESKHDPESDLDRNNESPAKRESVEQTKSKKVENMACEIDGMEHDPDYREFLRNCKIVDGRIVYRQGDHTVVYGTISEENEKPDLDDTKDISSDVEVLEIDKDSFENHGWSSVEAEFRQQLISVLGKPYDNEEHDRLWEEIERCTPKYHHKELRNGREISYATDKDGKSYLDHHPDLMEQLLKFQHNKPKCLNLLRGYFFWLQKCQHEESFRPWQDAQCCSVNPGSH